jgi:hypothetical protein
LCSIWPRITKASSLTLSGAILGKGRFAVIFEDITDRKNPARTDSSVKKDTWNEEGLL